MSSPDETYLGDGLYASFDGWQFRLRAPREFGDHIVLAPQTGDDFAGEFGLVHAQHDLLVEVAIHRHLVTQQILLGRLAAEGEDLPAAGSRRALRPDL